MKIFVLDTGDNAGIDFAFRCTVAGHEVKYYTNSRKHPRAGRGLFVRVSEWEPHMKWADLIFMTDNTKYHDELDKYFKEGYPILGTNPLSARLEIDREYGQETLKNCGIPVPEYQLFDDYDAAEKYVMKCEHRLVSKPCGEEDKAMSYVADSKADMMFMLRRWRKLGKLKSKFMLQKFIPGVEMGVSGWFGPGGFCAAWEENFEHKKLMNDDKGVNTGEMGTAIKYVRESKLAEMVLAPLTPVLHTLGFVGDCDMNVIIDEEGTPWPLEFTIRPGWPSFYIQSYLHKGDPAEWMLALVHGEDKLRVSYNHSVGVVLTIPDFPYSHLTGKETEGIPIYGLNEETLPRFRLGEVMVGTAPCMEDEQVVDKELLLTAGDYVGCVVGDGKNVMEAKRCAYDCIKQLEIPNSLGYRTDIGRKLEKQLPMIQKFGFAEEWKYDNS